MEWNGRTNRYAPERLADARTKYYFERKKKLVGSSYHSRSCYDNIFSRNKGHLCDALVPRLVRSIPMRQSAIRCNDNTFRFSFLIFPDETGIYICIYIFYAVLFRFPVVPGSSNNNYSFFFFFLSRYFHPIRWNIDTSWYFVCNSVCRWFETMTRYNYSQSRL